MQSLNKAFRFIGTSYKLAKDNPQIQKSWVYLLVGSLALLFLWFIPLALAVGLIGVQPIGLIIIGIILILTIFSLVIWREISALKMCRGLYQMTHRKDQAVVLNEAEVSSITHEVNTALWTLALPGLQLIEWVQRIFKPNMINRRDWLDAQYLVLPVIALEDLTLTQAVARVQQMVKMNLIRVRPGLVKVRLIARVAEWLLLLCGAVFGFVIARNVADPSAASALLRILGMGIGLVFGGLLTTTGYLFSVFARTSYYTALYEWVINVESATITGDPSNAAPPEILKKVMGMNFVSKKER